MVKVLMVGHGFSVTAYRKLLKELSLYKDLELHTIYPNNWKDDFKTKTEIGKDEKINVIKPTAVFVPHMYRFFYPSPSLLFKVLSLKPDIIHINEEPGSIIALQAWFWAKLTGAKVLFNTYENIYRKQRFPLGLIYKIVTGSSQHALAIHEECVDVLRKKGYKGNVKITYLGFDPEKFVKKDVSALKKKFGVENFAIGFMGRLSQEKGILTLIEACSKLNFQYHLILDKYVNTDFIKEMEEKAKELNVMGKIRYIDPAYEEVQDYINMFDVLVLPSETAPWWKEQFGRV
ncbi:MAG: glycosyltransferase, partial [Candidatus Diapherotrites archaeon]